MIFRNILFISILFIGCGTASKTVQMRTLAENNKDVVALSHLIRDYLRSTHNTNFTLEDIIKKDTSGLIAKNFSGLEAGNWPNLWRGGYAVYFKFSAERNKDSVTLTKDEWIPTVKARIKIGRNKAQLARQFDGVIHFHYPERGYHINEIILKEPM